MRWFDKLKLLIYTLTLALAIFLAHFYKIKREKMILWARDESVCWSVSKIIFFMCMRERKFFSLGHLFRVQFLKILLNFFDDFFVIIFFCVGFFAVKNFLWEIFLSTKFFSKLLFFCISSFAVKFPFRREFIEGNFYNLVKNCRRDFFDFKFLKD